MSRLGGLTSTLMTGIPAVGLSKCAKHVSLSYRQAPKKLKWFIIWNFNPTRPEVSTTPGLPYFICTILICFPLAVTV